MEWRDVMKSSLNDVLEQETVRMHLKVLNTPFITIDEMVHSMQYVYASSGFRVEVMSLEYLDLPHLMDLDIDCYSGRVSAEQDELFNNRNNVGTSEVVVYFVRSTIPPTNGCASHPNERPGVVITRVASPWTLGHEIGHVLDLNHVSDPDQLMYGGGTQNITNLPPDLISSEIETMKDSPYTI